MSRPWVKRGLAALTVSLLGLATLQAAPVLAHEGHTTDSEFKVLLFTKTAPGAYRHTSMDAAIQAFQELGAANGIQVDQSDDANVFSTSGLSTYDAVVMVQSSGMVWDTAAQRAAAQEFVRGGHGIVALHNATDMNIETEFPWWDEVVMAGAHMTAHSSIVQGTAKVADKVHPSTAGLPDRWQRVEEWYNFEWVPTTRSPGAATPRAARSGPPPWATRRPPTPSRSSGSTSWAASSGRRAPRKATAAAPSPSATRR